ncbi:MAG: hypothetical protein K5896_04690 [Prevotella sp.]|nr:hypothetical protein [Prevotella sp.]
MKERNICYFCFELFLIVVCSLLTACFSCSDGNYQDGYEIGIIDGEQDGYWKDYKGHNYNPERGTWEIENPSSDYKRGYDDGYNKGFSEEVRRWSEIQKESGRVYNYQCPNCKQYGATQGVYNYYHCVNCNTRFWIDRE